MQLKGHDTHEDVRFNPPIRSMIHRPNIKRALQCSETTFNILQFFILGNDLFARQATVRSLEDKLAVNFAFPKSALIVGSIGDMPLVVQVDLVEFVLRRGRATLTVQFYQL